MDADDQTRRAASRLPAPLPSEEVILSAPMSYTGSAQRIIRLRRRVAGDPELAARTAATMTLIAVAWAVITVWYLMWGLLLVPYRLVRRNARRRRIQELRHRELLATLGSAGPVAGPRPAPVPAGQRVGDAEREQVAEQLRDHLLAGRLTTDEFEERLDAAHRARTRADLDALTADLPQPAAPRPSFAAPRGAAARPPMPPRPPR